MKGMYDIRDHYIAFPPLGRKPLLKQMEDRINYLTSEFIMNGGTGVWGEDVSYTLYRGSKTKFIDAYDFEYMKGGV